MHPGVEQGRYAMRQKVNRQKRKGYLLKILLCGFVIYSAANLIKLSIDLRDKQVEVAALKQNIEAQQVENDTVRSAIDKGMTKEEVEKISRDKLDLASQNERVFVNIDGE